MITLQDPRFLNNLPTRWPDVIGAAPSLEEGLVELRAHYAGLNASLRRLLNRIRNTESAGIDPLARAVAELDPESPLGLPGYREVRRQLEALVGRCTELLREVPLSTEEWLRHIAVVVKTFELAHATAGNFCDPGPRARLGETFIPFDEPGNVLDQTNLVYYRLRGSTIYEDFITAVSHDPLQAQADAMRFCSQVGSLPDPLRVLEVGVGGGQYAADFRADCARRLGRPVHYCMGDISPAMLKDALAHSPTSRDIEVLGLDELNRLAPYALQRHNELFTDLPCAAVLYADKQGKLYRATARGTFPEALLTPEVSAEQLHAWLTAGELEPLGRFGVQTLEHVDWEVRFEPFECDDPALKGRSDVLFSYQNGPARFFRESLERAHYLRIVDYGIPDLSGAARSYEEAVQVIRRYGASATRDLLFDMFARIAQEAGRPARVVRLEQFVAETTGQYPVFLRLLAGVEGTSRVSRVVSGPTAPFPLKSLRHFEEIASLAGTIEDYTAFLDRLQQQGWVRLSMPGVDWPHVSSNLEKLAIDLDFEVNAIFRRPAIELLKDHVPWFTDEPLKQRLAAELVELGFAQEPVLQELRNPTFGRFWVLEVGPEGSSL
ncbi:hypothetical protein DYH09_15975 [bacterium CPR1]|nr:hypothetical protein [bacterium CPR1]